MAKPGPAPDPNDVDRLYKLIRSKVEHEDELVHQRLTWMITLHGLLFTAYGFSLSAQATALAAPGILQSAPADQTAAYAAFFSTITLIRQAMVWVGILSSCAALIGAVAAFRAIRDDATLFKSHAKNNPGLYPDIIGRPACNFLGMLSGMAVPVAAGLIWARIGGFIQNPLILVGGGVMACILILIVWPLLSSGQRAEK